MIEVGTYNLLIVLRKTSVGLYLGDQTGQDILLPNKYVPEHIDVNDEIEVFVYKDSEDRLIATTLEPKIKRNEFAVLRVKEVNDTGAFLDWGLEKDLMVPYREQSQRMRAGEYHVVYLYLDEKTERLVASNKIDKYLEHDDITVEAGEKVQLVVWMKTDLGFNVIVNGVYKGLVYENEIYKNIRIGDQLLGYIKQIREDGKIDVSLQASGHLNIEPSAQEVLEKLKQHKGFLKLNDNSSPESIAQVLEMSKKTFKKSIGSLYKQKLIRITDEGIYLNE